jgi:hypothetical protein
MPIKPYTPGLHPINPEYGKMIENPRVPITTETWKSVNDKRKEYGA